MCFLCVFQMAYLLVFRAHYIQDVVTGFLAPFFIEHVTSVLDLRNKVKQN